MCSLLCTPVSVVWSLFDLPGRSRSRPVGGQLYKRFVGGHSGKSLIAVSVCSICCSHRNCLLKML